VKRGVASAKRLAYSSVLRRAAWISGAEEDGMDTRTAPFKN
jgi:hypothetical protein